MERVGFGKFKFQHAV